MAFDKALLEKLQAMEEELGPRGGQLVPVGVYPARLSYALSEVADNSGYPVLRPVVEIDGGEFQKRKLYTRCAWYGSPNSKNGKSIEENTATARRMTGQFVSALAWQAFGNPTTDASIAGAILEHLQSMGDDTEDVKASMVAILEMADGVEIAIDVRHREDNRDKNLPEGSRRVYAEWAPYIFRADFEKSYDEGMLAAGIDTDDVPL